MYLRPVLPEDREALASMLHRVEAFRPAEVDVALELLDDAIAVNSPGGYQAMVAVDADGRDERPLGYACYGPTPMTDHTWDLYWLAVDPEAQGSQIGAALVEAVEGVLRGRGGRLVRVETSSFEDEGRAVGFYERNGFERAGRIEDFYRVGDDLLIYAKRL